MMLRKIFVQLEGRLGSYLISWSDVSIIHSPEVKSGGHWTRLIHKYMLLVLSPSLPTRTPEYAAYIYIFSCTLSGDRFRPTRFAFAASSPTVIIVRNSQLSQPR